MMTIASWERGDPCERHFQGWCHTCRTAEGIVRAGYDGDLHYDNDCVVMTYREITGAGYEEALEALTRWGYKRGQGALFEVLEMAFTVAGYTVAPTGYRPEQMPMASFTGPVAFVVTGWKGRKGHAWSVTNGRANRPYYPPFKCRAYAVTTA